MCDVRLQTSMCSLFSAHANSNGWTVFIIQATQTLRRQHTLICMTWGLLRPWHTSYARVRHALLLGSGVERFWWEARASLTLQVTRNVILDLVVSRRAEKQGAVHQGELLEHGQRSVAKGTVDHVPLARAEGRQDKPAKQGWETIRLRGTKAVGRKQVATQFCCHWADLMS